MSFLPIPHREPPIQRPLIPEVCLRFQHPTHMPHDISLNQKPDQFRPQQPCYIAPTQYSTQIPLMVQISPGVWSDGRRKVMSANHPDVRAFIAEARRSLKLPLPPSEVVFVLAALEVFYKPGDPVHWLFWSDHKKCITAEVVTRISLHQPALIRSDVAWNGTPEYLSILANHHGSTWRQFFENKDWYPILVPPKSGVPKVLNLRKRKVAPGAMCESKSPSPDDEQEEEPISKRSRNLPARITEKRAINNDITSHIDTALSPPISNDVMPLDEITPLDTPHFIAKSLPQDSFEEKEPSSQLRSNGRQQRRRKRPSPKATHEQGSDANESTRGSSNGPVDSALAVLPDDTNSLQSSIDSGPTDSASSTNSHARNRSTSYASAGTLVGSSHGRRSSSILSTCTAVDGGAATQDKKKVLKEKGSEQCDSYESENRSEADATTNEADDDESVGVVTRGRARGKTMEKTSSASVVSRPKATTHTTNSRKRTKKARS
ncbi:hypothetical protein F5887DRAFT_1074020 [Amanita rubescens]|nr:hypothetical protein F5887DRAFT_1074020 [Amanita rubescens]